MKFKEDERVIVKVCVCGGGEGSVKDKKDDRLK